jgi:hypothetical protein
MEINLSSAESLAAHGARGIGATKNPPCGGLIILK